MASKVKEAIEEVIEESYLLGLSQEEIRQDFKRFIDACYTVIQQNVRNQEIVTGLVESLAREQTLILIAEGAGTAEEVAVVDGEKEKAQRQAIQDFSEKVARRKRQILRTVAEYDPKLVRLIDAQRFQGDADEPSRSVFRRMPRRIAWCRIDWHQVRLQLLKVGYATTIVLIVFLIWLGFIQKS
ncbi:MAG: hypothetical protein VX733_11740 [Candidatus Latescibacterota bacterium]|nr:hypothetical protein [Candidatus Latescibacterota bacterium]